MLRPKYPEITLVIQGKFNECATSGRKYLSYKRYFKHIIVSTWEDEQQFSGQVADDLDAHYIVDNPHKYHGVCPQNNLALHVQSTLNGLVAVITPFALKIRGDEYRERWDKMCQKIIHLNKFTCDNCHFIRDREQKFHVGDHSMGGSTVNMLRMFGKMKDRLPQLNKGFTPEAFGIQDDTKMAVHSMFGMCGVLCMSPWITMEHSGWFTKKCFDVVPVHEMGRVNVHSNALEFDNPSHFYAKFPGNINEIEEITS